MDQNSLLDSRRGGLDLSWLRRGKVTEDEVDMMEDCRDSCPPQVLAASSNTALADLGESLDSVSTYMAASSRRQNEMARLEDTGWLPVLASEARPALSLLRSAWQPTRSQLEVRLVRRGSQWR